MGSFNFHWKCERNTIFKIFSLQKNKFICLRSPHQKNRQKILTMKSMTVEAKDDGYCSSESSRCSSNESSMECSMKKIIYGIEALIDDFDDPCTFAEIGINCWIMNNSKQPLEPEKARQPSPLIRTTTVEDK